MKLRISAYVIWFTLPYVFVNVVLIAAEAVRTGVDWGGILRGQPETAATCLGLALAGTTLLWLLPVRHMALAAAAGAALGLAIVLAVSWIQMKHYGGSEENIARTVEAFILCIPSCVAGAVAGMLRAKYMRK
ncbi:MAG TPA: hypothetical protein VGL89_07990 [Candidatus Koribacter sp.]|jgi:hypothetical protein